MEQDAIFFRVLYTPDHDLEACGEGRRCAFRTLGRFLRGYFPWLSEILCKHEVSAPVGCRRYATAYGFGFGCGATEVPL